ncbi:SecDF P1 head subdomain-containing protein [Nonlabens sp.]|uniref:SecDF P1 head subdomain-containing protein n=1 Tax=Nonlabens sp. TaxID=1888209 RepID=UPI003F69E48A
MKKIIVLFLFFTSCSQFSKKDLQLNGPTIEEAELLNRTNEKYVDGIYSVSEFESSLEYFNEFDNKNYFVNYRPVIVAQNFKNLKNDLDIMGRSVISVELHKNAHDKLFKATEVAFQNRTPVFIVIEGKVISAPVVNGGPISGGRLQISTNLTKEENRKLIEGIIKRNSKNKK